MNNQQLETPSDETTFAKETLQCELGSKLRLAREEKGLSEDFVVKELKFSKNFLLALEGGNWENLPGEVYALGFMKQYATLLGLDLNSDIERIKSKSFELKTPVVYRDVPISPQRKWSIAAVILFIGLIVIVNVSNSNKAIQKSESSNAADHNSSSENIDLPPTVQVETVAVQAGDIYTQNQVILDEAIPEKEPVSLKKTYSFYAATNDVWLQVSEINEEKEMTLLREVLLKKGQSFSIIDTTAKLVLTAGNARALEILEGNQVLFAAGMLGQENKVLKNFPINP